MTPTLSSQWLLLQIIGEYENVKSALLQVTGRLRENYFPRMGFHSSDSATACSSSNGRVIHSSSHPKQLTRLSSVNQLDYLRLYTSLVDYLRLVHESSHPLLTGLQQIMQRSFSFSLIIFNLLILRTSNFLFDNFIFHVVLW